MQDKHTQLIAKKFFEAASNGKNPYRATDGITTSLKELKGGRKLGQEMLKQDLLSRGINDALIEKILENLGI